MRSIRQRTTSRKKSSNQQSSPNLPQTAFNVEPNSNPLRSRKRKRRCLVFLKLVFFVLFGFYGFPLLFGEHPVHGGYLGMFIDIRIRKYLWNKKLESATNAALDWGLDLPKPQSKARTTNVPHAITLEVLHRALHRNELLQGLEQNQTFAQQNGNIWKIPRIILRQQDIWSRPISTKPGFISVDVDESYMDSYIQKNEDNQTIDSFHKMKRIRRNEFFFISFLSRYGGAFSTPFANQHEIEKLLTHIQVLESLPNESKKGWARIKNGALQTLIVPPNHEFLVCVKDALRKSSASNSSFQAIVNEISSNDSKIIENSNEFFALPSRCNRLGKGGSSDDIVVQSGRKQSRYRDMRVQEISVSISAKSEPTPKYYPKTTIDEMLSQRSQYCQHIWLWPCHRCLKSALHGTYAKCSLYCGSCSELMYTKEFDKSDDNVVSVDVDVTGYRVDGKSQMIPRVVHQTWFEDITPLQYPNLNRLQNSWKNSGWTYNFYTDDNARQYIKDYFPVHFLDAYDALIPGAYKADLFRYMLLMREGGIYADVDVLLGATLDAFVTPTMSFFVPRDAVAEYAEGQYCLWNGLIGAAPGHQIIVRAVERLVNLILNRADLLDLERDVAQNVGLDTEVWKLRAVQELLLSGPCALGIAANEVLGNDPLSRFDVGWLNSSRAMGDVMILMQDKDDMSAMRFTDVERNILFASTDMLGLNKSRLEPKKNKGKMRLKHYSDSGKGFWLWGTNGVYKNELVSERKISIKKKVSGEE